MKVKILKQCMVEGKTCEVGATPEVSEKDAKYLIAIGKADLPAKKEKPAE